MTTRVLSDSMLKTEMNSHLQNLYRFLIVLSVRLVVMKKICDIKLAVNIMNLQCFFQRRLIFHIFILKPSKLDSSIKIA